MAKETYTIGAEGANPRNAERGKTYQQLINQYARIMDETKKVLGKDFMALMGGKKKTTSAKKLAAISRMERSNRALNRYTRNFRNARIFETDENNMSVNYGRDANKKVSRSVYAR